MNYSPTFITALILIGIYTAQIYTNINNTNKTRNILYFIALTLFMAIINLLFGDRIAAYTLGAGIVAWTISVLLTPSPVTPLSASVPRCVSSSAAPPTCLMPTYECQQCDGTSDTIDCIDLKL